MLYRIPAIYNSINMSRPIYISIPIFTFVSTSRINPRLNVFQIYYQNRRNILQIIKYQKERFEKSRNLIAMTSIARTNLVTPLTNSSSYKNLFKSLNFPPGNRLAGQLDARLRVKRILTRQSFTTAYDPPFKKYQ